MFEVVLTKRGRSRWDWRVLDPSGKVVMGGREYSRPEVKYQGERALFLLLAYPDAAVKTPTDRLLNLSASALIGPKPHCLGATSAIASQQPPTAGSDAPAEHGRPAASC